MSNDDNLTVAITVDVTPDEAFAAINDVRGWWTGEIDGPTDELGAEFTYRYEDAHRSTQRVTELVPGQRVAWHVTDSYLSYAEPPTEWTGTDITFDIIPQGPRTEIRFTHDHVVPTCACYDAVSDAWGFYIGTSLRELIAAGQGQPSTAQSARA